MSGLRDLLHRLQETSRSHRFWSTTSIAVLAALAIWILKSQFPPPKKQLFELPGLERTSEAPTLSSNSREERPTELQSPSPRSLRNYGSGSITVFVLDRVGETLSGASVNLTWRSENAGAEDFPLTIASDTNGEARFTDLPSGPYMVRAELDGEIGWATAALGGKWPSAVVVDIVLKPAGSVAGRVVDTQRRAIPGASVELIDELSNGISVDRGVCSDSGEFLFSSLPVSQYKVQATAPNYGAVQSALLAIDEPPVTLVLGKGARLSGAVFRDSDRSPLADVAVGVTADDYRKVRYVVSSDALGAFWIDNLPPGTVSITSDDPRYTFDPPQIFLDIPDSGDVRVELLAADASEVTGRVFDPTTNQSIIGAIVEARGPANRTRNWLSAPTDEEGRYRLVGLPPGTVRLLLEEVPSPYTRGLNESEQFVELQPGSLLEGVDFEVPSGLTICGTVVDEEDNSIVGATVSMSTPHPRDGTILGYDHTVSDADGAFCFANVGLAVIPVVNSGFKRGIVNLEANYRGARSETVSLSDVAESVDGVKIKLLPRPSGIIAGLVIDERGKSAMASLKLSQPEHSSDFDKRLLRTDADGHFLFQDLAPGEYEIWMAPDNGTGYNAGKKLAVALTLEAGQRVTDLRLVVSEGGVITGTIQDDAGSPLQGAGIEVWDQNGEEISGAFSDREGHFRITNLDDGQYELRPRIGVPGGAWSASAQPGDHVEIEVPSMPPDAEEIDEIAPE
jgi:protocatechuate 3,4-dioxygenase beta subunit